VAILASNILKTQYICIYVDKKRAAAVGMEVFAQVKSVALIAKAAVAD